MNHKDFKNLFYNPFWGSTLIPHFISGSSENKLKFELVYLLFPFVLYKDSRKILANAKSTSSLHSLFLDNKDGKVARAGFEKRYNYFKDFTDRSMIVAANSEAITIGESLRLIQNFDYQKERDPWIKEYYKASRYLGFIFSQHFPLDILIMFQVIDV